MPRARLTEKRISAFQLQIGQTFRCEAGRLWTCVDFAEADAPEQELILAEALDDPGLKTLFLTPEIVTVEAEDTEAEDYETFLRQWNQILAEAHAR